MSVGAVITAMSSAFFFAAGATLQQREAARHSTTSMLDPRLLWQLAHRPWWVLGMATDGLSAGLHILALSLGSIALVQPLGVTGLLFAIPLVAILRRHRIRAGDIGAAVVVLAGLVVLLRVLPTGSRSSIPATVTPAAVVGACAGASACALALARRYAGRTQALVLSAAAGTCFGVTATLTRLFLQALHARAGAGVDIVSGLGVVALAVLGYWLQQNAYRVGHFAASLATATVIDPVAAIGASVPLLGATLPHGASEILGALACGGIITVGVAMLVRSPAHLFEAVAPDPVP